MDMSQYETVHNPGNSVYTCAKVENVNLNSKYNEVEGNLKDVVKGYPEMEQHPMYRTSSNKYGSLGPCHQTTPQTFHGISSKFSEHLNKSGMYRNQSLNTSMDEKNIWNAAVFKCGHRAIINLLISEYFALVFII